MPSDKNKTQTELVPINIREGLQKIRSSLNLLTVSGLILILALIALGVIFGLKNNQGIDSLVNLDLNQALDQSRQSMNEKERYIEQLVNQIWELEQELVRVRAQNPELAQLEEQAQLISKLEEQISRLQEDNLKKSLEYSKALDKQNDRITRLQEELSESYDITQEQSDAVVQALEENSILQSTIDEQNNEIARLKKELSESYGIGELEGGAVVQALEENSVLQSTIDEQNDEIARLQEELSESYGIGEQEGDAVVQALEENSVLQSRIDEQNDTIARLNKLLDQACDCETVENPVPTQPTVILATYVKKVKPQYPREARREGTEGSCESSFIISETGKATDIEIECTDSVFRQSVFVALEKSMFKAKTIDGEYQTDERANARHSFTMKD